MKRVAPKYKTFSLGFGLAVVADQFTKHLILNRFEIGETHSIIPGFFNFTSIRNPGAAFGFLSQIDSSIRIPFFILVPLFALSLIFFLTRKLEDRDIRQSVGFSLIASGALGNLLDRIQFGHVVDFLDFHIRSQWHYPVFNFADVAICLGVGLLLLSSFRKEQREIRDSLSHQQGALDETQRS